MYLIGIMPALVLKKQVAVSSKEVSNSNLFDALNSVQNDDDLGTNEGNSKSAGKGRNSDVSPSNHEFFNVASSSTSTTSIVDRIYKIERQIIEGNLHFWMMTGSANADSESEVEDVVDDHVVFMASTILKRGDVSGYGTNNLWERWRLIKRDDEYDPYDDDLYESHNMYENLQAICDYFDITVYGRKKKLINFDVFDSIVI
nr:hypothetical protein [Tanacetum cinerariifolium]